MWGRGREAAPYRCAAAPDRVRFVETRRRAGRLLHLVIGAHRRSVVANTGPCEHPCLRGSSRGL